MCKRSLSFRFNHSSDSLPSSIPSAPSSLDMAEFLQARSVADPRKKGGQGIYLTTKSSAPQQFASTIRINIPSQETSSHSRRSRIPFEAILSIVHHPECISADGKRAECRVHRLGHRMVPPRREARPRLQIQKKPFGRGS